MKHIFIIKIILAVFLFGQTSDQIKQAKEFIQRRGMSETQVREVAKSKGYSDKQIDAAIKNEKNMKNISVNPVTESQKNFDPKEFEISNEVTQEQSTLDIMEMISVEDKVEMDDAPEKVIESKVEPFLDRSTFFGYDIFARDPALFQATSVGAVDPDYLIGPGDEIIVMLWGETQFRQVLTVDREGFVFIPEIGQVFVNGLNLTLLESKLFRVFSQSYASLNPQGQSPTTFLDVSLGNLRPLRIQVLGEVAQPGAYTVSPSATLFSALYYFNGPTTLGSLRDIQLIRGGEKITSIDFYDYLLTGKKPKDQKLQLDDIIFIPRRLKTVTIQGEINRSGIYELKPEEGFSDLISMAGDLKVTAYLDRSQIDRIVPFEDREELGMDRMYTDVNLGHIMQSDKSFPIQDGDRIQIYSVLDIRQNIVDLRGSVTRPGSYDLGQSLKISELINKADGLLGDAYMERVDVIRMKPDFTEELIKLNLGKALQGDSENDIYLQQLDRVQVYGMTEMIPRTYVNIRGHVKEPGRYFLQENMTLYDLIFKRGGFLDEEFKKRSHLERADLLRLNDDGITRSIKIFNLGKLLETPDSEENIFLETDDIIRIYRKDIFISNKSLSINGVVRNPGKYELKTDMNLKDLILEAGGLNDNVYRYRVEVARIDPLNEKLNEYAKLITFNMDEKFILSFNDSENSDILNSPDNFQLEPYDFVYIRPDPYFSDQRQVFISGEVLYPGAYTILTSNDKITDIIERAGGLKEGAYPAASQYIRKGMRINISLEKILKNPNSKLNFHVRDQDEIIITPHPNVINISGEINSSGNHKFVSGKRLRYYLKVSGGLSPDADKKNIWVTYPNGDSKKYNPLSLISPKVIDGSSITVGKKKEEEPFDSTEYAKEITAIVANLAQALTVVVLARN